MQLTSQVIINYLVHHGYIILFSFLAIELIGFPTPGEVLMSYAGYLVYQGTLMWSVSIIAASCGVFLGISISYFIGNKLGYPFFKRYGHYIHITPDRLARAENWYEKYGNNLILVAYFIPGIRHITGYFAGIVKIPYKMFAIRAYLGALVWATFFITLGKIIGPDWNKHQAALEKYMIAGGAMFFLIILLVIAYKYHKDRIIALAKEIIAAMMYRFNNSKLKVFAAAGIIIGAAGCLSVFMIGLIQDYLANEFAVFDEFAAYIIKAMFFGNDNLVSVLGMFALLPAVLICIIGLLVWMAFAGRHKRIEIAFMIYIFIGGEVIEELLRVVFHRLGPNAAGVFTFPSEQTFIIIVVYGFAYYMLFKYAPCGNHILRVCLTVILAAIMLAVGVNRIYLGVQYPSDIIAGYVFGSVWLLFNLIFMEGLILLKQYRKNDSTV